jgi:hypothetical protein
VDARSIVTQVGPSYSQGGLVVNLNCIIICGDMVATDTYCARLMEQNDSSFSASKINDTLQRAQTLGLGTSNLSQVEIIKINTRTGKRLHLFIFLLK